MAYIPTSKNPHITTVMLQKDLCMVTLKQGPDNVQSYIKQRLIFKLVIDNVRGKLVALPLSDEIIIEIDFKDILYAVCLDANKQKEYRHRIEVATKQGDTYLFYVDIPYQWDPVPFLNSLNYEIDCKLYPEKHKYDKLKSICFFGLMVLVFSIISALIS